MISRFLGNYKNFICIADKCPSTCCSGWAVEIDEDTLCKYDSIGFEGVDYNESTFINKSNGDCYFLNKNGLCNLYLKHGEGIFCRTCDMYPRHIEEFPNVREYSLSISCPVVARDYVFNSYDVTHIEEHTDNTSDSEDYDDFDEELYSALSETRNNIFNLFETNEFSLNNYIISCRKALALAAYLQTTYDDGELNLSIDDYDEQCTFSGYSPSFDILNNDYAIKLFDIFSELEPLNKDFNEMIKEYRNKLSSGLSIKKAVDNLIIKYEEFPELLNKITHYFIYTYFCGAAYDEYIYGMAAISAYSSAMILLLTAIYNTTDGIETLEEIAKIVYTYSRELEHSTENMLSLESLLEDNRL